MTKVLLSVHVLAVILVVGPVSVAASLFPRYAPRAAADGGPPAGVAAVLHRTCRVYAVAGAAVPAFGIATGAQLGVLTDPWLIASVILTAVAAAMLALAVLPDQRRLLATLPSGPGSAAAGAVTGRVATRLAVRTGIFNLLWVIVVVLMIVRPGSTTGV